MKPKNRQRTLRLRARKEKREEKAQERFTGLHTPKQANRVARAEARAEYGPIKRSLRSDLRASRKREREEQDWYNQLDSAIGSSTAEGTALFNRQQDDLTKRLAEAAATDRAGSAVLSAQDAKTVGLLGGPADVKGAATRATGNAGVEQQRIALSAPLAAEGANFLRYQGGRRVSARQRGIEALRVEGARRRKTTEDLRSALKEQGQKRNEHLEALRAADRDYQVQQVVAGGKEGYNRAIETQARLGLRGDLASAHAQENSASTYAGADKRTAKATERASRNARKARERSAAAQENTADTYGKNKDKSGYSVREAIGIFRRGLYGKSVSVSEAIDYLVNRGVDVQVAKAALRREWNLDRHMHPTHPNRK